MAKYKLNDKVTYRQDGGATTTFAGVIKEVPSSSEHKQVYRIRPENGTAADEVHVPEGDIVGYTGATGTRG